MAPGQERVESAPAANVAQDFTFQIGDGSEDATVEVATTSSFPFVIKRA